MEQKLTEDQTRYIVGENMTTLTYSPRLVHALPSLEVSGRSLKAYAMYADPARCSTLPDAKWLEEHAASVLSEPLEDGDHPAGFLILHYGTHGTYLLVSQWYDGDVLKHWLRVMTVDAVGDEKFVPMPQRDVIACVWELEIMRFERDAWVNTVMARGEFDKAAADAYEATTFSGWV